MQGRLIIACILFFTYQFGRTQNDKYANSFNNLSDLEIVESCANFCDSCVDAGSYEEVHAFVSQGNSRLINPNGKEHFELELLIGGTLYYQSKYKESLTRLSKALSLIEKEDWFKLKGKYRRFRALNLLSLAKFGDALNEFKKNYDNAMEHGDSAFLYVTLSDIAVVNYSSGEYLLAAANWEQYLLYCKRTNQVKEQASISGNLGLIYTHYKKYDKAEYYLLESYKVSDSLNLKSLTNNALNNLGKLEFDRQNFEKAEFYMLKSIDLVKNTGSAKEVIRGYINLGEIFNSAGKKRKAKYYLDLAYRICLQHDFPKELSALYLNFSDYYSQNGDYKLAFLYLDSTLQLKDSLLNIDKLTSIAEVETRYRVKQKDDSIKISQQNLVLEKVAKEDERLRGDQEKLRADREALTAANRSTQILGLLLGLILLVALALMIFRNSRINKQKNIELADQKHQIEIKNKNITDSIRYAKNLQTAILPDISIIREVIPNYVLFYEPRDIVSGDFYWFHESDDKVYIAAADCTGHGVPGAFVSMLCNDALNKVVITLNTTDPGQILTKVNQTVVDAFRKEKSSYKANDGMDIALCVLDKKTRNIKFSGAMNRLLLIRNKEILEYKGDKQAIGGKTDPNYEFATQEIATSPKDCIYMFSDGYIDQFGGPKGKKFMIKRFKELLIDIHMDKADEQKERLNTSLLAWRGETDQIDDVLVIGFEI